MASAAATRPWLLLLLLLLLLIVWAREVRAKLSEVAAVAAVVTHVSRPRLRDAPERAIHTEVVLCVLGAITVKGNGSCC